MIVHSAFREFVNPSEEATVATEEDRQEERDRLGTDPSAPTPSTEQLEEENPLESPAVADDPSEENQVERPASPPPPGEQGPTTTGEQPEQPAEDQQAG